MNGNNRARTCDPLLVRQVLSQLSYAPAPRLYNISKNYCVVKSFLLAIQLFLTLKHYYNYYMYQKAYMRIKLHISLDKLYPV